MDERTKYMEQELESCRLQVATLEQKLSDVQENGNLQTKSRGNLLTVFDGFSEPLFFLDWGTRVQMLNKAALAYCHTDFNTALGQRYIKICPLGKPYCKECSIVGLLKEGKETSFKRQIVAPHNRTELITLFPTNDATGMILRIQDVTEQEKMNEQLVLADRLASLCQLSRGVSHEIRNPLASIMLFVDILADPNRYSRSEQEMEILGDVKDNVRKITDIITRIFDFAGISSPNKRPSDLNKLMNDILELWGPKIKQAGIEVELSLEAGLPLVSGDSVELQQLFSNLILNGVEAMTDGGILNIATSTALSAFHMQQAVVLVTVQDTGKGIADSVRQTIFNPFFSTKTGQAGLGLTISHQIVKRHGGILSCHQSDTDGTVFSIELPLEEKTNGEQRE